MSACEECYEKFLFLRNAQEDYGDKITAITSQMEETHAQLAAKAVERCTVKKTRNHRRMLGRSYKAKYNRLISLSRRQDQLLDMLYDIEEELRKQDTEPCWPCRARCY